MPVGLPGQDWGGGLPGQDWGGDPAPQMGMRKTEHKMYPYLIHTSEL